jgi:hypothetical protein
MEILRYWVSTCAYICVTAEGCICLDLKRDRYLGIGAAQIPGLAHLVPGWAECLQAQNIAIPDHSVDSDLAQSLAKEGILTTDPRLGKHFEPASLAAATGDIFCSSRELPRAISTVHLGAFALACMRATVAMRTRSLERMVNQLQLQKQKKPAHCAHFDFDRAAVLTRIFFRLRPFVYTANRACLYDSLALAWFLARFSVLPSFVIGVSAKPFMAHSWLQRGSLVINADPAFVSQFTPILVV